MDYYKKRYVILWIVGSLILIFGSTAYWSAVPSRSNQNVKDSIVIQHDTVYVEKKDNKTIVVKPLPAITKFKATDWVCAWGKWSGVVREITWSTRVPNTLVYSVQHYSEEEGWYENEYVDTELEAGKCH